MSGAVGVLVVVAAHEPTTLARELGSEPITIGRDRACELHLDDAELSRRHCELAHLGDGRFRVADRDSQNGTWVNGRAATRAGLIVEGAPLVVRAGGSVLLLERDVTRFAAGVSADGDVVGPVLRVAYDAIERAAQGGVHLWLDGENGTGKERAAHVFHAASKNAKGPFVAINCATVERVRPLDDAANGVVFLNQLDALDGDAQRTLMDRAEAVPGALVVATAGARYHRIVLPPVRERRAEIPYLVAHALRGSALHASAGLHEQCLLRSWPANVRELVGAVEAAARSAEAAGNDRVTANELPSWAGNEANRLLSTTPDLATLDLPIVHGR